MEELVDELVTDETAVVELVWLETVEEVVFEDRVCVTSFELTRLDVVVDLNVVVDFDFILVVSEVVWAGFEVNDDMECWTTGPSPR